MAKCTLNRLTSVFILKNSCWKWRAYQSLRRKVTSWTKFPKKETPLHLWSLSNFCHLPEMPYLNPSISIPYRYPSYVYPSHRQGRVFRRGFQGASPTVRPFGAIKVDETKLVRKCSQPMLGLDLNGAKKTSPTRSDVSPTVGGRPQSPHCVIASELLSENSPSWGNLDMAEGKTKSVAFTCGWVGFSYRHLRVAYFTPMNRTRKTHFNESYVGLVYVPKMHCLQDIGHCDQCSDYIFNLCSWTKITNYFTSSDPHHDMLGGGCQVRVVIENMMGRMENLRTLISGFLGLVILVRWALVTMFLSWTTQTGCRIHRTYVSLIGSGEGRHTTHLLKCVPLPSTSQTDWKQSSDVLSDISFDILSDISSDISSDILSDISSDILSDISKPKPNIHSLQTLYLPHTTQQKSYPWQLCACKCHRPQCIGPPRQKAVKSKDAKRL